MNKGLEALEKLMADYYEMCQDLGNNDDQYQRCNLTSERAIIEKELKILVVLKDLFDFDFALRFPSNQPMLRITNKRTNEYWEMPISKEEYDLLKEVLL